MELIGKLKEQVEQAKDIGEAKNLIEDAGMRLSDEELEQVSGGLANCGTGVKYDTPIITPLI